MGTLYHKLVRDNIPDIIKKDGKEPVFRVLENDVDYRTNLIFKLHEEVRELQDVLRYHPEDKDAIMDEIADIKEICDSILLLEGINILDAAIYATQKMDKKGSFEKRIYLEEVK